MLRDVARCYDDATMLNGIMQCHFLFAHKSSKTMSNDNFSHPGNYTNEEFNGERNIAAPQNGNYTNEEFYGERNIPAPQLGRVYTYPAYFAPTANQSHFYLNSQYYNDQMQVPYQNEGAQMDGYQNNQVQASYQNLGGQWYNQVQAPYRNEEAQWDGKSDFGNSIAPYYEDSDLKNLDEIDEVSNYLFLFMF